MLLILFFNLLNSLYLLLYILLLPYYLISLYFFLFSFTTLSSTVATLIRDYQALLQSMIRMLLYLSPILWNPEGERVPNWLSGILNLNPFYYIIEGFRNTLLGGAWFFEDIVYTLYFWAFTFVLLYFGSTMHYRFRKNFVDYL